MVCRNEREQQKREEYRERFVCKLCEEKFKKKNELREHWEKDHKGPWYNDKCPVYESVHLYCEEEMETQVMEIGCMKCNMIFESEEEIMKHNNLTCHGIELGIVKNVESWCMKCNMKFESEEEIIGHNKWICDGIEHEIVKKFKKKEHE